MNGFGSGFSHEDLLQLLDAKDGLQDVFKTVKIIVCQMNSFVVFEVIHDWRIVEDLTGCSVFVLIRLLLIRLSLSDNERRSQALRPRRGGCRWAQSGPSVVSPVHLWVLLWQHVASPQSESVNEIWAVTLSTDAPEGLWWDLSTCQVTARRRNESHCDTSPVHGDWSALFFCGAHTREEHLNQK